MSDAPERPEDEEGTEEILDEEALDHVAGGFRLPVGPDLQQPRRELDPERDGLQDCWPKQWTPGRR